MGLVGARCNHGVYPIFCIIGCKISHLQDLGVTIPLCNVVYANLIGNEICIFEVVMHCPLFLWSPHSHRCSGIIFPMPLWNTQPHKVKILGLFLWGMFNHRAIEEWETKKTYIWDCTWYFAWIVFLLHMNYWSVVVNIVDDQYDTCCLL